MAFSVESEFLDLKKVYQNFEYESLSTNEIIQQVVDDRPIHEGITQNTYLFVTQKTTLLKDVENLSLYFLQTFVGSQPNIRQHAVAAFPFDKVTDRVCYIFQKYQEQPSLLDSLLEGLIQPIMNAVKQYLALLVNDATPPCRQFHLLLTIVYQLTKVRGKKYTTKYFPHEVKDLEPAIAYLVRWKDDLSHLWESKYVIILWLSVIILVPFDLVTIDSQHLVMKDEKGQQIREMAQLLIETSKVYLRSTTKLREAAALFLSKLFTRPDVQKRDILSEYITYVLDKLSTLRDDQMNSFFICGLYSSLKCIFKTVTRSELLPKIPPILQQIRKESQAATRESPVKKTIKMKLLTRIGLVYLKPRVAKWAYRKSKVSLKDNLKFGISKLKTNTVVNSVQNMQGNYGDDNQNELEYYKDVVKTDLEQVIDLLIEALSQKDTSVREASSKGLGMICGRLSPDMILDILDHLLDLPPSPENQHSICLALAELIRRNLLSPQKLRSIFPFIVESLLYQREQGGYSVGQAVRDAACYMSWAVARGYEEGGQQLGVGLMIAACFDREVGCRRAASAAYQQLVGRVGVPHGIQILTEADYFTLGLQKNSYLNVGIFVASYEPYFKPFAEHLGYQKLRHWDLEIKKISACSLSLMCPLNPQFMSFQLLPALVSYLQADTLNIKLGSIIGIGEILIGLAGKSHLHQLHNQMKDSVFLKSLTQNEKKLMHAGEYMTAFKAKYDLQKTQDHSHLLDPQLIEKILNTLVKFIQQNLYKGKAGENLRVATCRLFECIAMANIPLSEQHIQTFTNFIEDNIKNPVQIIINAAVKGLKPFSERYHTSFEGNRKFVEQILKHSVTLTPQGQGYTLAISSLSSNIKIQAYEKILAAIESNCEIKKDKEDDAVRRKNAVIALESIVEAVGFKNHILDEIQITRIFRILFKTTNDYSTDKRGDIGSVVREASMKAMLNIIGLFCSTESPSNTIPVQLIQEVIQNLLQQLAQKIDRMRLLAGSLLQQYFDNWSVKFPDLARRKELEEVFQQQNIRKLIKQDQEKIDKNLETEVIEMEMKIQEDIFHEDDASRQLIYYWNLPHCVFAVIVPLLGLPEYSYSILKGLCTSAGGISESVIKYSLQELGNYVHKIAESPELIQRLIQECILILQKHYRDERIVNPIYKTLDFLMELDEITSWDGMKGMASRLYTILNRECGKSKMIMKIASGVGLYVHLLVLNDPTITPSILANIVAFLSSDLPKVRKILADKLLLLVMSQEDYEIFDQEQSDELTMLLSEHEFLDEKLDVGLIKEELTRIFRI